MPSGSESRPTTRSASADLRRSSNWEFDAVHTFTDTPGHFARNTASVGGSKAGATVGRTPSETVPGCSKPCRDNSSTPSRSAPTHAAACGANRSPSRVGSAPRRPRSNKRTPRMDSSSAIVFDTAGCVIDRLSAARCTLPNCVTARKHCRCRNLIRPLVRLPSCAAGAAPGKDSLSMTIGYV